MTAQELSQIITKMDTTEALRLIEEELSAQGDNPDDDVLLMKIQLIFDLANEEGGHGNIYFLKVAQLLPPLISKFKLEPIYPYLLYMQSTSLMIIGKSAEALPYVRRFYDTHDDDTEASFLLAACLCENKCEFDVALTLIDYYIERGDCLRAMPIKIDILSFKKEFEAARLLIEKCRKDYPEASEDWDTKELYYYCVKGEADNALPIIDKKLAACKSSEEREIWLTDACKLFYRYYNNEEFVTYLRRYLLKYPKDIYAMFLLAGHIENVDPDGSIALYDRIYKKEKSAHVLHDYLKMLMRRHASGDSNKYFRLLGRAVTEYLPCDYESIRLTVYGDFYKLDCGQSRQMLLRYLEPDFEDECVLTMLGKVYEMGVGVTADGAKAFEYYTRAYISGTDQCGCGKMFYAYALYFGIGTEKNEEKAKQLILEIIDAHNDYIDRKALYAVFAFSGDNRFDGQRAIEMLRDEYESDANCAFLLWLHETDERQKAEYREIFMQVWREDEAAAHDYFKQYADDPTLPFVPFIRN